MSFTPEQVTLMLTAGCALLGAFCYLAARKASWHQAKAEVYQEFADTFGGMVTDGLFRKRNAEQKAEAQRHYMRLALVDPLVRDGLRSALLDADEYWHSPASAKKTARDCVSRTTSNARCCLRRLRAAVLRSGSAFAAMMLQPRPSGDLLLSPAPTETETHVIDLDALEQVAAEATPAEWTPDATGDAASWRLVLACDPATVAALVRAVRVLEEIADLPEAWIKDKPFEVQNAYRDAAKFARAALAPFREEEA